MVHVELSSFEEKRETFYWRDVGCRVVPIGYNQVVAAVHTRYLLVVLGKRCNFQNKFRLR